MTVHSFSCQSRLLTVGLFSWSQDPSLSTCCWALSLIFDKNLQGFGFPPIVQKPPGAIVWVNMESYKKDDDIHILLKNLSRYSRRMLSIIIIMACRHIPTMTKSHHGGEMTVMIKVGMCQWQNPTIHDKHDKLQLQQLALVSCSTRPQC